MSPDNQVRQSDGSYVDVGQRLRELREERRMSLRETAGAAKRCIRKCFELDRRGISLPSVSTLYRLVDALGVPITAIFRSETDREEIVFRSPNQRTKIPFSIRKYGKDWGEKHSSAEYNRLC